jgi:hypothetical protein
MTCNRCEWNRTSVVCSAMLSAVCSLAGGCDRDPAREMDIQGLQRLSQRAWAPSDAKERIARVIAKYHDGVRDAEPILIMATLTTQEGTQQHDFALWVFDEDKDLSGILVREESHGADGTTTVREEQYPVFAHLRPVWIATAYGRYSVPIRIRDAHQRKDEKQWADYLAIDFEKLVKEKLADTSPDFWYNFWRLWESTMPAVWISLPEPNRVDVSFYIYDKAGHKSNGVNLLRIMESRGGPRGQTPN